MKTKNLKEAIKELKAYGGAIINLGDQIDPLYWVSEGGEAIEYMAISWDCSKAEAEARLAAQDWQEL